jgi:hypothetical protein
MTGLCVVCVAPGQDFSIPKKQTGVEGTAVVKQP